MEESAFGTRKPLPHPEYEKIFTLTGLDVDGRRALIERCVPWFDLYVDEIVTFSKAIPGYSKLCVKDQILLLKGE